MVKNRARDKVEAIRRTDASWKKDFARSIAEVESEIRQLEHELPILEHKLAAWAPMEPLSELGENKPGEDLQRRQTIDATPLQRHLLQTLCITTYSYDPVVQMSAVA